MSEAALREHWLLDPQITFLNHGSFGACPRVVLDEQRAVRERLEREPVRFMLGELEPALDRVRFELHQRFNLDPNGVAFVPNATTAVATVLDSLSFAPGDEILMTDHTYAACANVVTRKATACGATVSVARVPFPLESAEQVLEAVLARANERTRLALLDHVTSPTALVFPIRELVVALQGRGIDVLVDGAHTPGMLALDLDGLGAAYYAANFHKWCCAPKGAGMLYVRSDRREGLRPLVASHGMTSARSDRSRFLLEFDWTGTQDPSAYLSIPRALRFLDELYAGGLPELRRRNHELTLRARALLLERWGIAPPCPESMLGSMATLPLPAGGTLDAYSLNQVLFARYAIEAFVHPWPAPHSRVLRICVQAYNELGDYERLAGAVAELLAL